MNTIKPMKTDTETPHNATTWDADLCDHDPDNCWIDRATGEHVNATTNTRTQTHQFPTA